MNIERTMSCPPQLSVDSSGGSSEELCCERRRDSPAPLDLSSPNNEVSPVRSSSEMMRGGVDMSELVRKLSGQRQCNTDSSEGGHDDDEEEDEEGGAHDTITSLAGAHMLQKFSRIGSGRDRKFRGYKNKDLKGSITQLENLFKEEKFKSQKSSTVRVHQPTASHILQCACLKLMWRIQLVVYQQLPDLSMHFGKTLSMSSLIYFSNLIVFKNC